MRNLAELIPALRGLSQTEKVAAMQFLLDEICQSVADTVSPASFTEKDDAAIQEPRLYRKDGVLVVETAPLRGGGRDRRHYSIPRRPDSEALILVKILFDSSAIEPCFALSHLIIGYESVLIIFPITAQKPKKTFAVDWR